MDEHRLDGNAAGGLLGEIFAFEMTTAEAACANCGAVGPVGAQTVYAHGMGTVVRCRGCGSILMRVARQGGSGLGRFWLDLRGVEHIKLEEAP